MSQHGTGLEILPVPKFTDYVVVAGTWKEKDNTQVESTEDGDGSLLNHTSWSPGVDATCTVVIKKGATPLKKSDVLAALAPDSRKFFVMDVDTEKHGGKPAKQSLTLSYKEDFDPSIVVEEEV